MLLQADPEPVDLGCLKALCGHSGITEADKNGVVGPTSAIQTNKVLLVDGQLAINRKEQKYYKYIHDKLRQRSEIKYVSNIVVYTGRITTLDKGNQQNLYGLYGSILCFSHRPLTQTFD